MRIIAFDLSTVCIGCVVADVIDGKVNKIKSAPIVPPKYTPEDYLKSKKKLRAGEDTILAWAKPGETTITKIEKKRRDVLVRNQKDIFILSYISRELNDIITAVRPDLIVVEKNEIFNGILTSVLLGKVMGTLHGVAGIYSIPIKEYRVQEVRKPYNVFDLVLDFKDYKSSEELQKIPDIAKRAIRDMLEKKYDIKFLSDDESDACLVLDYHINYKMTCEDWR